MRVMYRGEWRKEVGKEKKGEIYLSLRLNNEILLVKFIV